MIEIKTVLIVAFVYYASIIISQFDKFKKIAKEYRNDSAFWRVLVWLSWLAYPIICPVIVALYLFVVLCKKVTKIVNDAERYKYSQNRNKAQERYRHGQRR